MARTLARKKELTKTARWFIFSALLLNFGSTVIGYKLNGVALFLISTISMIQLACTIIGVGLWFVGLRYYAMSKGYHPAWAGLGILNIFGLLILILMPNKYIVQAEQVVDPLSNYPRQPLG